MSGLVNIMRALTVMLALPATVLAQDWDCSDYGSLPQQGMNACAWQDFQAADSELNAVYQDTMATLKADDYGARPDGKTEAEALRETQRAWIAFRDLACDMEGIHARGGTMERLLVYSCLADKTRARTEDLKYLTNVDGG